MTTGAAIDDSWRARRREALHEAWREVRPHVLLFELFPFGRRQLRFEIVPLLDAAIAGDRRPCIASSVRDILVAQHKPARNDEMLGLIERYFDRVLVHGDPNLVRFDRTFAHAARIADKIAYTGYVVDRTGKRGGPGSPGHGEVVVSAGGGAVGLTLLQTAIAARAMTSLKSTRWRVLVGISVPEADFDSLAAGAPDGVVVERARSDFPKPGHELRAVDQPGRLQLRDGADDRRGAGRSWFPTPGGIETEQTLRAKALEARGAIHVVDEAEFVGDQTCRRGRDRDRWAARPRRRPRHRRRRAQRATGQGLGRGGALVGGWRALAEELDAWAVEGRQAAVSGGVTTMTRPSPRRRSRDLIDMWRARPTYRCAWR